MEETTTQYNPVLAAKRDRHYKQYKRKYMQARNAVIMLLVLFVLMALVMCWTLSRNRPQQRINDKTMLTKNQQLILMTDKQILNTYSEKYIKGLH